MPITNLQVIGLRNLQPVTLNFSSHVNIFYGNNGSGKTSLLEAIYLLGLARSFRTHKIATLINYDCFDCTVFAKVENANHIVHQIGINRNKQGDLHIKIDTEQIRTAVKLATILPLQIINPDSFLLLEGAPKLRRQFLDWGVFHDEPRFLLAWQRLHKSLKQRNSWLKNNTTTNQELSVWNQEFSASSEDIDTYRKAYITKLIPVFNQILIKLLDIKDFSLKYYRGWDKDTNLLTVLDQTLTRDLQLGYTQAGSQRADLRLKIANHNAVDILSRGQQKLVVCALKIAQGYLMNEYNKTQVIYLIDDLASELDFAHRLALCKLLENLNCQIFITGVDKDSIYNMWTDKSSITMFHVEHGQIKLIN